jgi:hypothetical protein
MAICGMEPPWFTGNAAKKIIAPAQQIGAEKNVSFACYDERKASNSNEIANCKP